MKVIMFALLLHVPVMAQNITTTEIVTATSIIEQKEWKGKNVVVSFIEEEQSSLPVVFVTECKDADSVMVQTFYRTTKIFNGKPLDLLLSKEKVLPCYELTLLGADPVPATVGRINSVVVTLFKTIDRESINVNKL